MHGPYHFYAKYGAGIAFYFCVQDPADVDRFLNVAIPWVAGDATRSNDGAAPINVNTLPTRVGTSPLYKWLAGAAELQATRIDFLLVDQNGPVWSDLHIVIETRLLLGQLDIDATQIGGNTHAMTLIGVGTGYGLYARGSSGIRGEAIGASGHGIQGVGIGAGDGFSGVGGVSNGRPCNFWETLEGAEPVVAPANNATFGEIQQSLKRRHANKVTQTSSAQTWYRDNSSTVLASRTVSDDLVTQVQNKLT